MPVTAGAGTVEPSDLELMRRTAEGDREAFAALYRRHHAMVYRFARLMTGSEALAVTERWFSPELQMAVLITRSDPRAGDTVYRLTNIVRAEPHEALFVVPPGYELRNGNLSGKLLKMRAADGLTPTKKK